MSTGIPHAANGWAQLPERDVDEGVYYDRAVFRKLKAAIKQLSDQADYQRGTYSGKAEYLNSPTAGTLDVPHGGTGIPSGNSGGLPFFSSATSMSSTGVLGQNQVMVGGGIGNGPTSLAMPSTASRYALTATTGSAAPLYTLATSAAVVNSLALRDAAGSVAMVSLTASYVSMTNLTVTGAATMAAVGMTTLTATAATFSGTINAQAATFTQVNTTRLNVSGAATMAAVGMATLTATAATFTGNINAQAATFTGLNASNLNVSGASTLAAVGMSTLTGTSASFSLGLNVTGATTLAAVGMTTLTATAATFSGSINAQGATFTNVQMATLTATAATFSGSVSAQAIGMTTLTASSATFSGTVRVGAGLTVATAATMAAVGMATLSATAATFTGAVNMAAVTATSINMTTLTATYATFSGTVNIGATLTGSGHAGFGGTNLIGNLTVNSDSGANSYLDILCLSSTAGDAILRFNNGTSNATPTLAGLTWAFGLDRSANKMAWSYVSGGSVADVSSNNVGTLDSSGNLSVNGTMLNAGITANAPGTAMATFTGVVSGAAAVFLQQQRAGSANSSTDGDGAYLVFQQRNTNFQTNSQIGGVTDVGTIDGGRLEFWTKAAGQAIARNMVILSNGNASLSGALSIGNATLSSSAVANTSITMVVNGQTLNILAHT